MAGLSRDSAGRGGGGHGFYRGEDQTARRFFGQHINHEFLNKDLYRRHIEPM